MEDGVYFELNVLRKFMFENVYLIPAAKKEEETAFRMLSGLFDHFMQSPEKLPKTL